MDPKRLPASVGKRIANTVSPRAECDFVVSVCLLNSPLPPSHSGSSPLLTFRKRGAGNEEGRPAVETKKDFDGVGVREAVCVCGATYIYGREEGRKEVGA